MKLKMSALHAIRTQRNDHRFVQTMLSVVLDCRSLSHTNAVQCEFSSCAVLYRFSHLFFFNRLVKTKTDPLCGVHETHNEKRRMPRWDRKERKNEKIKSTNTHAFLGAHEMAFVVVWKHKSTPNEHQNVETWEAWRLSTYTALFCSTVRLGCAERKTNEQNVWWKFKHQEKGKRNSAAAATVSEIMAPMTKFWTKTTTHRSLLEI